MITKPLQKYLLLNISLTAVIAMSIYLLTISGAMVYLSIFPWLLGSFSILSIIIFYILLKMSAPGKNFNSAFMLSLTGKMLLYLVFILIYLLHHKENRLLFIAYFGLMYISYSILNTSSIFTYLKGKKVKK